MMTELEERSVLWIRGVPERDAPASNPTQWLEQTLSAAESSGGRPELTLGLTLILSFDGIDLEAAVEFARHTLEIARACTPPVSVHIGLALGSVSRQLDDDTLAWLGTAFDRAQML